MVFFFIFTSSLKLAVNEYLVERDGNVNEYSPVARPEHLAMFPYKHFWAFLISSYHLVTESTGCRLHTRLAFSKSKMADKMAAIMLEMT